MGKTPSRIGLGCMRLGSLPDENAVRRLVDTALENGINLFDHADIYGAGGSENAVAVAWLLRHPAGITPIVGTMNAKRLQGIAAALSVTLSREDWYALYLAAGKDLP